jgi:hypothetical protein
VGPLAGAVELHLTVQINNQAGFEQVTVLNAEEIVTGIFRELGMQVAWLAADDPGNPPAGLRADSPRPDLRINLVAIKPAAMGGHNDEVGLAGLPGGGRPGFLAWVFAPTLERIIDDVQYLTPIRVRTRLQAVLLGHVIAHEMGHLLMGSAEHSDWGLMTLGWDLRKVRLGCTGRLRFSPEQAARIRAVVEVRNGLDNVSANRPSR